MTSPWTFAAAAGLLITLVAWVTYRSGRLLAGWTPPANLLLSWPDNLLRLLLVGACLLIGRLWGPGPAALGWGVAHLRRDILWGIAAGVLLAVILGGAGWLCERVWGQSVYSSRMIRSILPADRREWPGVLLALLPAAALEELLFRSLPLGGLAGWLALSPSLPLSPSLASCLLLWPLAVGFGLLHWPQGAWGVIGTALAAIALSLLFLATGSLWAPLVAHYLFNLLQLIAARLTGVQPLRAPS